MIDLVDFCLHFRGETNSMQLVTALQPADNVTNLGDLAYAGLRIAVFNVNTTFRLRAFGRVIVVVRHIARAVFDEVVVRIVPRLHHAFSRCG